MSKVVILVCSQGTTHNRGFGAGSHVASLKVDEIMNILV